MPYTPPAYNAVVFNFTGAYSPPAYNSIVFNFGGGGGGPAPVDALPTARNAVRFEPDEWFFVGPKRATPPGIGFTSGALSAKMMRAFSIQDEDLDWFFMQRKRFAPVSSGQYRIRAAQIIG